MKKIDMNMVVRILVECIVIWMLFVWKNGVIVKFIVSLIGSLWKAATPLAQKIWNFLVYIFPYSRNVVKTNAYFRLQLNRSSFAALVCFIAYVNMTKSSEKKMLPRCIVAALLVWYLLYFNCFLLVMIPETNVVFGWVSVSLAAILCAAIFYRAILRD